MPVTFAHSRDVPVVQVVVKPEVEPASVGNPDESVPWWESEFPAHPEQYAPMPFPEDTGAESTRPEGEIITYDRATRKETISQISLGGLLIPPYVDGSRDAGAVSGEQDEGFAWPSNFSALDLTENPEVLPWSANVKRFFRQSGSNRDVSGALIDPLHVLTAGHCVHEGDGGDWSTDVVVVPGYDDGSRPYGEASWQELRAWTAWTQDGDLDHDIGVIDLDRPVGALSRWLGYSYNNDCSFYTGNTHYSACYPGTNPYDGERMYYSYGTFDSCETNESGWYGYEIRFDSRVYKGQSGSGVYYLDVSDRHVYAVLSNSDLSSHTDATRLTSDKFELIRDHWMADDTPSTLDLIPSR